MTPRQGEVNGHGFGETIRVAGLDPALRAVLGHRLVRYERVAVLLPGAWLPERDRGFTEPSP